MIHQNQNSLIDFFPLHFSWLAPRQLNSEEHFLIHYSVFKVRSAVAFFAFFRALFATGKEIIYRLRAGLSSPGATFFQNWISGSLNSRISLQNSGTRLRGLQRPPHGFGNWKQPDFASSVRGKERIYRRIFVPSSAIGEIFSKYFRTGSAGLKRMHRGVGK